MAIVVGGSKMNLVTFLNEGDDYNQNYGKNRYLAQTFTLDSEYVVWRFRLKSWTLLFGEFYHYALRLTDGAGAPIGGDLYHTTLSPTGEVGYSPGKWRRFDFDEFPVLPAGTYAIVASVPFAHTDWDYKLRADSTDPLYTQGKAWISEDDGDTWVELPGLDFMFEVWGYQRPPEPPPPPVIGNWAPLELEQIYEYEGYRLVITTDNMCHLYIRYTWTEPLKHPQAEVRRGLSVPTGTRYCFVTFEEKEQEESGDTITHEFKIAEFPVCSTLWYYFIGTKQAEEMPSSSAIFSKHKPPPPKPYYFYLYPNGDTRIINIRNISPTTPTTHWDKVRYQDTTFDPDYGVWGLFSGSFVYEKYYYNDDMYHDLYTLQDPPNIKEPIVNVVHYARLGRSGYPYGKYRQTMRTHGMWYQTDLLDINFGLDWYTWEHPLNPYTGQPWTLQELKDLWAGIRIGKGGGYGTPMCDQIYVRIETQHYPIPGEPIYIPDARLISQDDECRVWFDGSNWQYDFAHHETIPGYVTPIIYKAGYAMIFRNLPIPENATIESAHLYFSAFGPSHNDWCNTYIKGQRDTSPLIFSSYADYIARPRTNAFIDWTRIPHWDDGVWYISPNFKAIIQEIINLPAWVSGSDVCLFWNDHDDRSTHADYTTRMAETYHHDSSRSPYLVIKYSQ